MTAVTDNPIGLAEQEANDAEELAVALEERIKDGDEDVTFDELSNAKKLVDFARLRVEAAKRKVAAGRREAAIDAGKALAKSLPSIKDEDAAVVAAWVAAVKAMRKLDQVFGERVDLVTRLAAEISEVDETMRRDAGVGIESVGVLPAEYSGEVGFQVPAAGIKVRSVALGRLFASVAHEGLSSNTANSMHSSLSVASADLAKYEGQQLIGWPEAIRKLQANA